VVSKPLAIDAQGFAGGFTMGMVQAGFELAGKRELPGGFGVANCEANRHLLGSNWETQVSPWEEWEPRDAQVVFGNPPCSGFSLLSHKDFRGEESKINACMWAMAGYASKVNPDVLVFESVQQAYQSGRGLMQRLRENLEDNTGDKYELIHVLHNAASIGGAAIRKRYFFVASRVPFGIEAPTLKAIPTLHESIGDLQGLGLTWSPQPYRRDPSWWAESRRSESGVVDGHMGRNTPLANRAYDLMKGVEWPAGKVMPDIARKHYNELGYLPESWKNNAAKLVANDFKMGFYTMMRWDGDRPARVITGGGVDLVLHYEEERLLTHREVARIQGFPDDWRIEPLQRSSGLQLTWGKGIPVDCGKWIGKWIKRSIEGDPGDDRGIEIGERERLIDITHHYKTVRPVGAKW
jgi:DNA (cytosine-5)-methyltransferase 1